MPQKRKQVLSDFHQMLSKALTLISKFQTEQTSFKREFCFNHQSLREYLLSICQVIEGYFALKKERIGQMSLSGLEQQVETEAD